MESWYKPSQIFLELDKVGIVHILSVFFIFLLVEEVRCDNHDHPGFVTLNEVFDLSCDQIFELLFTESDFYRDFVTARKTYGEPLF